MFARYVEDYETEEDEESETETRSSQEVWSDFEDNEVELEDWMLVGGAEMQGDHDIQLNLEFGTGASTSEGKGQSDRDNDKLLRKISDTQAKTSASFRYFSPGALFPDLQTRANDEDLWKISDRDRQAKTSAASRYFSPDALSPDLHGRARLSCSNCRKTGHIARQCPSSKKHVCCILCGQQGHRQYSCPQRHCLICGLPAHTHLAGAGSRKPTQAHLGHPHSSPGGAPPPCPLLSHCLQVCMRCGLSSHLQEACPDLWRQYHLTTEPGAPARPVGKMKNRRQTACYNCGRGHCGHKCFRPRMPDASIFFLPYVCHYDTAEEVQARHTATLSSIRDLLQRKAQKRTWPEKRRERQETKRLRKERERARPPWMGRGVSKKNNNKKAKVWHDLCVSPQKATTTGKASRKNKGSLRRSDSEVGGRSPRRWNGRLLDKPQKKKKKNKKTKDDHIRLSPHGAAATKGARRRKGPLARQRSSATSTGPWIAWYRSAKKGPTI
ncbi:hypothetical protein ACEWY4_026603 [Coilia grayii]|uniref:Zinc finger CCHC domain-containing protein 7 n=1 Tax=Coilia grayii TaxID=363190 RepID=A0ABD1IQ04_9TELE